MIRNFLWNASCCLLKVKRHYDHFAAAKIVPFPHQNTIAKPLAGMKCKFEISSFALSAIQTNLRGKAKSLCYVNVLFDEIKIKESVTFDIRKLHFDGYVDYGDCVTIKDHNGQIADHVIMITF